jgi:hypothetical protein
LLVRRADEVASILRITVDVDIHVARTVLDVVQSISCVFKYPLVRHGISGHSGVRCGTDLLVDAAVANKVGELSSVDRGLPEPKFLGDQMNVLIVSY